MKALIYIEVINELKLTWSLNKFKDIQKEYSDYEFFEIDNFSDEKTIELTKILITKSEKTHIIIKHSSSEAKLNKILSLFSIIKQHKHKIDIETRGIEHPHIKVLLNSISK